MPVASGEVLRVIMWNYRKEPVVCVCVCVQVKLSDLMPLLSNWCLRMLGWVAPEWCVRRAPGLRCPFVNRAVKKSGHRMSERYSNGYVVSHQSALFGTVALYMPCWWGREQFSLFGCLVTGQAISGSKWRSSQLLDRLCFCIAWKYIKGHWKHG